MKKQMHIAGLVIGLAVLQLFSCKKFIEVDPPFTGLNGDFGDIDHRISG